MKGTPMDGVESLAHARERWRQRVLAAEARLASVRRRLRLCRRAASQAATERAGLQADLGELEQQAAAALASRDERRALDLAGRIRSLDDRLQEQSRRVRRLTRRGQRLRQLEQRWQWRIEQHRRADQRRCHSQALTCRYDPPSITSDRFPFVLSGRSRRR